MLINPINILHEIKYSKPKSSSILKKRNECAIDVISQEGLHTTIKLSADEDSGEWLAGFATKLAENSMDGRASVMEVELDDSGADTEAEEEVLGYGGKAAVG
jgi:hypothetical protein